jgi:hypothetical protein
MNTINQNEPRVVLSVAEGQRSTTLAVHFSIIAPDHADIYVVVGSPEWTWDPMVQPGVCLAPLDQTPLISFVQAELPLADNLRTYSYAAPELCKLAAGKELKGDFSLSDTITEQIPDDMLRVREAPRLIPPRFFLDMVVGWGTSRLETPINSFNPREVVQNWQSITVSNRLTIKRDYCWTVH